MKFRDLRPGETFELDGRRFRKSGPLTAASLDGGADRVLAFSTRVAAPAARADERPAPGRRVPARVAAQAIEEFYTAAHPLAERCGGDRAAAGLADLRRRWRARLGLPD